MTEDFVAFKNRIANTPELQPYRHFLLYEWNQETGEGDEFFQWALMAPVKHIVELADEVLNDWGEVPSDADDLSGEYEFYDAIARE